MSEVWTMARRKKSDIQVLEDLLFGIISVVSLLFLGIAKIFDELRR